MPIGRARLRISDYTQKRKAGLRKKERRIQMVSLSLTSMVDMFAILVIYLLTSSTSVTQWMQLSHNLTLPKAKYTDSPVKAATLEITSDMLYAEDTPIISIKEIQTGAFSIPLLKTWLRAKLQEKKPDEGSYVNIVGDEKVPFGAMRRIVATCQEAGFETVNLAIQPTN